MQTVDKTVFESEEFIPKWWALNAHMHTIIASLFSKVQNCNPKRIEIPTPDDDFMEVDLSLRDTKKPIVTLFHGLEGSSNRYYISNLMYELNEKGYSVAALNFRGCGSRLNKQRQFYHSGDTDTYQTFFNWIKGQHLQKEIYAIGFSLGGNALVKYLGEQKEESLVEKAIVVSPPFDLKEGSLQMQKGFNKIYEWNFLKTLVDKLERKREKYPDMPEFTGKTIYDFDDQITAPLHGFKDAEDYYHRCSSKHFFKDVKKPLLVIHSKADPLCPIEYAPLDDMEQNVNIDTVITEKGGHVGFLSDPEGWLNKTIIQWLENGSGK